MSVILVKAMSGAGDTAMMSSQGAKSKIIQLQQEYFVILPPGFPGRRGQKGPDKPSKQAK